jgi:hypothetical protein
MSVDNPSARQKAADALEQAANRLAGCAGAAAQRTLAAGKENELAAMDILNTLNVLKRIEAEWGEFRQRAADLAPRFETVVDEDDLAEVFGDLLDLWEEYPLLAQLLANQGGEKRPPASGEALKFNPKETAVEYHSLLIRLTPAGPPKVDADDPRTDA